MIFIDAWILKKKLRVGERRKTGHLYDMLNQKLVHAKHPNNTDFQIILIN